MPYFYGMAVKTNHRFIDEAGDTTFFLKGKKPALGTQGVSSCFCIGMVKINDDLEEVRHKIRALQDEISADPFFQVPSVVKKINKGGYYLHATDDIPEVRYRFIKLIQSINCSFEAVVGEKSMDRYERQHDGKETVFYSDLLSHLIKNKLHKEDKLVLHISERGKCTKNKNLEDALNRATQRIKDNENNKKKITTKVVFNVNYPTNEPLLNLADYFCWSVQRVFERGDIRYYESLKEKIKVVVDLYDTENYKNWKNYYGPKNPLTAENKKTHHHTIP